MATSKPHGARKRQGTDRLSQIPASEEKTGTPRPSSEERVSAGPAAEGRSAAARESPATQPRSSLSIYILIIPILLAFAIAIAWRVFAS